MNRSVLIAILTLAIIAALFWFFLPKSEEKMPGIAPIVARTSIQAQNTPPSELSERRSFRFFDTIAPLVEPFEGLVPSLIHSETSLRGSETDEATPLSPTGLPHSSSTSSNPPATTNKKTPLTEQEIFNWIWPDDYRRGLAEIETLYINQGYIAQRPPTNFNDEKNIYQFLAETLDVAEAQKWIIPSDAQILRKGLKETLPLVIEHDKNLLRQGMMPISFLPKDIDIAKLRWVILANIAHASPGWVTSPDCYKDDVPLNPLPGPNLWAECCNCGFKLDICGTSCCAKYKNDCGTNNKDCIGSCGTIPLGCLNLACGVWPNAIWDPLTGICGCG